MAAYIKFDGVDGECVEKDHKGWIDVLSYGWGIASTPGMGKGGGGGVDGKVQFQDFHFTSPSSKASPKLAEAVCNGKVFPKVEFHSIQPGPDGEPSRGNFVKLHLVDVSVGSLSQGGQGDERPIDQVIASFKAAVVATPGTSAVLDPASCAGARPGGGN